jgi:large exoprotein involved in heme utilization and adhesion
MTITDGASISSETIGKGNAGNIDIQAQNIDIAGTSFGKTFSSQVSALSNGDFAAGSININTESLNLSDRGLISVSNLGNGNSGNLNITASNLNLNNSATLEATVNAGSQGNINLNTDNIFLRNNSEINAKATGTATGGNIAINNTDTIVLLDNIKIIADALQGNGWNINITTQGLFISSDSLISASSEFGLDGTVEIDEFNSDRNLTLNQLPAKIQNLSNLITPTCSTNNQDSFAVTATREFPIAPTLLSL